MINTSGLVVELKAAGIGFSGCNSNGVVWDMAGNEIQGRPDVAAIILAHNPAVWGAIETRIATREGAAKATAKSIPSWAMWTQEQWQAYFNTNLSDAEADLVTSLATARVMIKRQNVVILDLVKMVIALRDQVWPDLPE